MTEAAVTNQGDEGAYDERALAEDPESMADWPREEDGRLQRPCIEEFKAAGYTDEQYDARFPESLWGPGWSNPDWGKPATLLLGDLPEEFFVHSKVRHVSTRTLRSRQPTRHRFKQYLFGNPSLRLVRKRPVRITAEQLVQHLDELLEKEGTGVLTVHLKDGRQLSLAQLKTGVATVAAAPAPAPIYNPPMDSIAHDIPSGNALPQYVDGTFPGDPAAQRAVERMVAEKSHEAARQGADAPESIPPLPAVTLEAAVVEPTQDAQVESEGAPLPSDGEQTGDFEAESEGASEGEFEEEAASEEEAPIVEEAAPIVDPAAARSTQPSRGGKKRRNR